MFRATLIAGLAFFGLAAPAAAQSLTLRDLSVGPVAPPAPVVTVMQANLDAWFDRASATYALGEAVTLLARPGADGYISAFSVGPTGDVTQIYPNAFHPDNFVRAGQIYNIPGAGARAIVTGPVGVERIEVILSANPNPVVAEGHLAVAGQFRNVVGGVATFQRDLSVVAANSPAGTIASVERMFQSAPPATSFTSELIYGLQNSYVQNSYVYDTPTDGTVIVIPARGYPLPRR